VLVVMQRYSDIDANAATRPTRWRFFGVRDEVGAYVLLGLLHAVLAVAATDANSPPLGDGGAQRLWQRADGGVRVLRRPAVQHGDGAQGPGMPLRWQVAAGA